MKKIKRKYKNKVMSNGLVPQFNTSDISVDMYDFYSSKGFDFIFEYICKTCKDNACKCVEV